MPRKPKRQATWFDWLDAITIIGFMFVGLLCVAGGLNGRIGEEWMEKQTRLVLVVVGSMPIIFYVRFANGFVDAPRPPRTTTKT